MSAVTRVAEQVHGILTRAQLNFHIDQTGNSFIIPFGSTACQLDVGEAGEQTLVGIRATVLENVDASGDRRGKILERLNEINNDGAFGTMCMRDGDGRSMIFLQHQLLADELDTNELLNALDLAAARADSLDDELMTAFETGETWAAVQAREKTSGDQGVVSA